MSLEHGCIFIIFSGLPGVGKTTLSKELARQISATYIRIDTIEQAIKDSSLNLKDAMDAGYIVSYKLADDNLKIAKNVVIDCVNPLKITRDSYLNIGKKAGVKTFEIEVICSDSLEHKKRIQTRKPDIIGQKIPNWQEVCIRYYEKWDRDHIIIDTAGKNIGDSLSELNNKIFSTLC